MFWSARAYVVSDRGVNVRLRKQVLDHLDLREATSLEQRRFAGVVPGVELRSGLQQFSSYFYIAAGASVVERSPSVGVSGVDLDELASQDVSDELRSFM